MYHCWKTHHLPPSEFYNMSHGEKLVLSAFFLKEMEEIQKQNEAMGEYDSKPTKSAHISDEELTKLYGERPDNI